MRSLQRYFIMSTYSMALAVVTTSSVAVTRKWSPGGLFRIYLKQRCVQSSKWRSFGSSIFNSHSTSIPSCRRNNFNVAGCMLNVQNFKLFHSSNYLNDNFSPDTVDGRNNISISGDGHSSSVFKTLETVHPLGVNKKDDMSIDSSPSQLVDLDSDEDLEERQKQDIWEVAPTPLPTFNFAAYANDSEIIKKFADLGVNLSRLETKYGLIPFILKLDFEKHVAPCIRFLCDNGISPDSLGWYFTKNPFILQEDLRNVEKRLDYLRLKKFPQESILRIIRTNPYWLSFSVTRIDRRLGFFQTYFKLRGSQVKELAEGGPKLITFNLNKVKDVTFKVKEEMGFSQEEIVTMLLARPKIWRQKPDIIWRRFDYLHNEVKISHEDIVRCPDLLLVRETRLKNRIGFLQHLGRAQFDPENPHYVTFKMMYSGDDVEFATSVARSSVLEFNDYMKSL